MTSQVGKIRAAAYTPHTDRTCSANSRAMEGLDRRIEVVEEVSGS